MKTATLAEHAASYLRHLCITIPSRRVGSAGNRAATDYFAAAMASCGFTVETPGFDCMDWQTEGAQLTTGDNHFEVFASPYSLGCNISSRLQAVTTLEELSAIDRGGVLLLHGAIADQQLMPKNFPFYNPEEHQVIIQLLEKKQPAAIVSASPPNPDVAGAVYPLPMIEDGDFNIPSVYMTKAEGQMLATHAGEIVTVESRCWRIPASGCNVIARKGPLDGPRIVLFAHIDAKHSTPGALDNAAGTSVMLLVAELLANYDGALGIEIVALNGEDYYSNPGEQQYLTRNTGRFGDIVLGINIDGAGYREGETAYSLYGCPPGLTDMLHSTMAGHDGLIEGEQWYQGDHWLFMMNERPALAVTSERMMMLLSEVIHTSTDTPELVDTIKLAQLTLALNDVIRGIDRAYQSGNI